jgi:VanZ family protein
MTEVARRAWWSVAGWALFQLTLTSLPTSVLPSGFDHPWDLAAHVALYTVLGALTARAAALGDVSPRALARIGLLLACGAALDEFHQRYLPGRDASVLDWVADLVGCGAGLALGARMMRSKVALWLR